MCPSTTPSDAFLSRVAASGGTLMIMESNQDVRAALDWILN